MGFLKKFFEQFTALPPIQDLSHWIYVQCSRCGEKIRIRIDLRNDLSLNYGEGSEPDTYFTRKTIIGEKRCYQQIEVELTFDHRRRLVSQDIRGGKFISEEEYLGEEAE